MSSCSPHSGLGCWYWCWPRAPPPFCSRWLPAPPRSRATSVAPCCRELRLVLLWGGLWSRWSWSCGWGPLLLRAFRSPFPPPFWGRFSPDLDEPTIGRRLPSLDPFSSSPSAWLDPSSSRPCLPPPPSVSSTRCPPRSVLGWLVGWGGRVGSLLGLGVLGRRLGWARWGRSAVSVARWFGGEVLGGSPGGSGGRPSLSQAPAVALCGLDPATTLYCHS